MECVCVCVRVGVMDASNIHADRREGGRERKGRDLNFFGFDGYGKRGISVCAHCDAFYTTRQLMASAKLFRVDDNCVCVSTIRAHY